MDVSSFPRRQRRSSARLTARFLDDQALALDRKRFSGSREVKIADAPTSRPSCCLEELVTSGFVGRKVEEEASRRLRGERWQEDEPIVAISQASVELEKFLSRVASGDSKKALTDLALFKKDNVLTEPVTFDQLTDALESVDGDRARTVILLSFGATCVVRRGDSADALPLFSAAAAAGSSSLYRSSLRRVVVKCCAAVLVEIAACATRISELELRSDVAAAQAASYCARAATSVFDDDAAAFRLAEDASEAHLRALDCHSRAALSAGLMAPGLVEAVADALQKPDFLAALASSNGAAALNDEDDDVFLAAAGEDGEALIRQAAKRAARDVALVAENARAKVDRLALNAKVTAKADADARTALGVDVDDDETRERALDWRKEIEALARANHARVCDVSTKKSHHHHHTAVLQDDTFQPIASTKHIALTLSAIVRAKGSSLEQKKQPKKKVTIIGTQHILEQQQQEATT